MTLAKASTANTAVHSGDGPVRHSIYGLVSLCALGLAAFLLSSAPVAGAAGCPNEALRVGFSAKLPNCRAYEQVSPVAKNGGSVLLDSARTRAAASGNALGYASLAGFGDVQGSGISSDYIAERSSSGWATHGITPRQEPSNGRLLLNGPGEVAYEGEFSDDLSCGVTPANAMSTTPPNVAGIRNLYSRNDLLTPGAGTYQLATASFEPVPPYNGGTSPTYRPSLVDVSQDCSRVVFESKLNLIPEASGEGPKLYESANGVVSLVAFLPESEGGGLALEAVGGRGSSEHTYSSDAVSADGTHIAFTDRSTGQLYLRIDNGLPGAHTVRVSASEKAVPDTPLPATFWAMTPDGAHIFFTTPEQLTDEDSGGFDVYRYDVESPAGDRLVRISVDHEPGDEAPGAEGVIGISNDGSWAYFLANGGGQLVPGAPVPANPSAPLIFSWHNGTLAYVGKLFIEEAALNLGEDWGFGPAKPSEVSPDGRHLLFATHEGGQVNPHDHGDCSATDSFGFCQQMYLYSSDASGASGTLACVSCDPSSGSATAAADDRVRAQTGGARTAAHIGHPLSDDGRFVFFNTEQALVPEDTNGAIDAYEYDTETETTFLVSSGTSSSDSYFLDAGGSGEDVFFATKQSLVGQDVDTSYDVYDARVDGGIAAQNPPPVPAPCGGETCRAPASGPPPVAPSSSSSFRGAGNVNQRQRRKKHHKRHQHRNSPPAKHGKRGQR